MGSPDQMRPPIPSAGQSSETETHTARSRKKLDQVSLPRRADGNMPSLVNPEDDNALHTTGDKRHASGRHLTPSPVPLLLLSLLWSLDYCEPSWRLPASGYTLQAGPRHVRCLAGQHVSRCMVGVFSLLRPPSWWPRPPSAEECRAWDWLRSHAGLDDCTAFLITLTVAASSEVVHRSGGEGVGTWNRPTYCEHGTDQPETWSEEVFPRSRARALCLRATRLGGC